MRIESDFLVIGSGIAGLSYALQAADHGSVVIITKRDVSESATKYAQGGIASVFSAEDSFDAHIEDTMVAGAGICHEDVVRMVVEEGPQTIRNLIEWGVKFTTGAAGTDYDLTREGGHSARRILHAEDITGREIERALVYAVRQHPNVRIYEHHIAIDLIVSAKLDRKQLAENTWKITGNQYSLLNTLIEGKTITVTTLRGKTVLIKFEKGMVKQAN